jgi:hypothetical protein
VDRVLERRSITHQSTVELSSKVLETHDDDGIVAITPLNIFSAEEKMGFLGTPDLLTCYGLGQARHAVQETNAVVGKSALYSPESEWTFTDDLTKSIVTGKQAFKLFEVDIARLCISSDQPQQLMDSDFKVPLPSRDQ